MSDHAASGVGVTSRQLEDLGHLSQANVVPPINPCPAQAFGHDLERIRTNPHALDEEHVEALVALLGQEQATRWLAIAPGAARLLVIRLERSRSCEWMTNRMSGWSMPMPKALVATITP